MNEVLHCLLTRRSVKKYLSQPVEEEKLEAVLEAGTYAACGMGRQAGKIVVLQNPDDIAQLEKMNATILGNPDAHPFYGAPVVLVVLADRNVSTHVYDGSLVMGNLLLAAHAEGLGACWIHRAKEEFDSEEGKQILASLGITGDYEGIGHCIVGYPAAEPSAPPERKKNYIYHIN